VTIHQNMLLCYLHFLFLENIYNPAS